MLRTSAVPESAASVKKGPILLQKSARIGIALTLHTANEAHAPAIILLIFSERSVARGVRSTSATFSDNLTRSAGRPARAPPWPRCGCRPTSPFLFRDCGSGANAGAIGAAPMDRISCGGAAPGARRELQRGQTCSSDGFPALRLLAPKSSCARAEPATSVRQPAVDRPDPPGWAALRRFRFRDIHFGANAGAQGAGAGSDGGV